LRSLLCRRKVISYFKNIKMKTTGGSKLKLVGEPKNYARAKRQALVLLRKGFDLRWAPPCSRNDLHER
jgi:hypothetical protein